LSTAVTAAGATGVRSSPPARASSSGVTRARLPVERVVNDVALSPGAALGGSRSRRKGKSPPNVLSLSSSRGAVWCDAGDDQHQAGCRARRRQRGRRALAVTAAAAAGSSSYDATPTIPNTTTNTNSAGAFFVRSAKWALPAVLGLAALELYQRGVTAGMTAMGVTIAPLICGLVALTLLLLLVPPGEGGAVYNLPSVCQKIAKKDAKKIAKKIAKKTLSPLPRGEVGELTHSACKLTHSA
jgi:hypothetical protein